MVKTRQEAIAPESAVHGFRPSSLQEERTFSASPDGITIDRPGKRQRTFAWADMRQVRIGPLPPPFDDDGMAMHLLFSGDSRFVIENKHVSTSGGQEYRDESFFALVAAVHHHLRPRWNAVKFHYGRGQARTIFLRVFVVVIGLVLLPLTIEAFKSGVTLYALSLGLSELMCALAAFSLFASSGSSAYKPEKMIDHSLDMIASARAKESDA